MPRHPAPRRLAPALVALAVAVGACSSKSDDQESAANDAASPTNGAAGSPAPAADAVAPPSDAPAGQLETGPGVTADTITLGVLTDNSGPFAGASLGIAQGRQLYWDARNADGGVCDRTVEFDVKDHAYNAQNATSLYAAMEPEVLAFDELLGSPMIASLLPTIGQDGALTMAVSFSSSLLDNPYVVVTGATYDIEMINAIQWLIDDGQIAAGDTVGHIYLEGDYGENALAGTHYAAEQLGVTIAEQKVQPTAEDLTAQVTALDQAGANVVLLTTTPPQTASAVAIAQANGLDLTFVGSNPSFSPALLASPAAAALEESYVMVSSIAPYTGDDAGPTAVRDAFSANFADETPTHFVLYGYAQGELMAQILETACANGALTRDGLLAAFQSLSNVDTGGLVAPMDFSSPGQPSAREVLILRPDSAVDGGLTVVEDLFASSLATDFRRGA
jgi:ABC-type branched-subunit amino acid transport system substrate-binding protein